MDIKLAYLAGIIDGEGHIKNYTCVNGRGEKHIYPRVIVTQKDERLIIWLKDNYGGCKTSSVDKRNGHTYWRWQLQGKKVLELARQMYPMLNVKKEQVDKLIP